jgi:hypothetical protein
MDLYVREILDNIQRQKCILFLGSQFAETRDGTPIHQDLTRFFKEQTPFQLDFEIDNLFLPKNPEEVDPLTFHSYLNEYYRQIQPSPIFQQIAEIPFHLIISSTPDLILRDTFQQMGTPFDFEFYNKEGRFESKNIPTPDRPCLYNLFGNIEEIDSLILSYEDLYDFIISILGGDEQKQKLPVNLQNEIVSANAFVFLGFNMEKWYIKLLFHRLEFGRETRYRKGYSDLKSVSTAETQAYFERQHAVDFLDDDLETIIGKLHAGAKERGILRQAQTSEVLSATSRMRQLLADDQLESVIDLLFEEADQRQDQNPELYEGVIILMGNHRKLRKDIANGLLTRESQQVERNQLIQRIQLLIEELEEEK